MCPSRNLDALIRALALFATHQVFSRKVHAVEDLWLAGARYTLVYNDFFKRHDQFAHSVQRIAAAKEYRSEVFSFHFSVFREQRTAGSVILLRLLNTAN